MSRRCPDNTNMNFSSFRLLSFSFQFVGLLLPAGSLVLSSRLSTSTTATTSTAAILRCFLSDTGLFVCIAQQYISCREACVFRLHNYDVLPPGDSSNACACARLHLCCTFDTIESAEISLQYSRPVASSMPLIGPMVVSSRDRLSTSDWLAIQQSISKAHITRLRVDLRPECESSVAEPSETSPLQPRAVLCRPTVSASSTTAAFQQLHVPCIAC